FEARNPKLETISNDKKTQCSKQHRFGLEFWVLFQILKLFRDFRNSDFEFRRLLFGAGCAAEPASASSLGAPRSSQALKSPKECARRHFSSTALAIGRSSISP